jgi:hypothetical protein
MKLSNLVRMSLIYYLREVMEDNDYQNGKYEVINAYPQDVDKVNVFPTISVERINSTKIPYQISSKNQKQLIFSLDIFGQGNDQREDLVDILSDELEHKYIPIYNFNSGWPSAVGVYGAIPDLGDMYVQSFSSHALPSPQYTEVEAKKFHEMINIVITLPLISV